MRPYVAPRLAVAVALSLSLAAPAHAAGGPIPSKPSRPMANVPLVEPAEAAAINASVLGGIGVSLTEDAALAAGGDGVLRLELPSAQPATMSTRDTRVRVHVPEPYTIDGVNARGWRCMRRGGGLGCSMARAVDAGSHPPIELRVDADPGGDDGSDALVTADASWRQSGRQQYNAHGSERLVARTGLGVTASTANATVLGPVAGSTPTPVVLGGHLARFIDGIPADYNWKQLDGPAVQWEGPSSGAATSEDVSARFTPPALTKPATLHFELTVSDWRGSASDRVAVRVTPQSELDLQPRRGTPEAGTADLDALGSGQSVSGGLTRSIELSGTALHAPVAGTRVWLRARGNEGPLVGARWRLVEGPRGVLAKAKRSGSVLRFKTPSRRTRLVLAVAGSVLGHHVTTDVTVHVRPRPPSGPRRAAAVAPPHAAQADDETPDPFCAAFEAAADDPTAGTGATPIKLGDGNSVTIGAATASGSACTDDDAKITFGDGKLQIGVVQFVQVKGTMTAKGLSFTEGFWDPFDGLRDYISTLPDFIHVAPQASTWGAPLSEGKWGDLTGTVNVDHWVAWIPLPSGWTWTTDQTTLTFRPSGGAIALSTSAQAPEPKSVEGQTSPLPRGSVTFTGTLQKTGQITLSVDAKQVVTLQSKDSDVVALSGTGKVTFCPVKEADKCGAEDEQADKAEDDAKTDEQRAADSAELKQKGTWTTSGSITLKTDPADKEYAFTDRFGVKGASATWDKDGIALAATAVFHVGGEAGTTASTREVAIAGTYKSTSQWSLQVTQAEAWEIGNGVQIVGLCGSIARRPYDPDIDDAKPTKDNTEGDDQADAGGDAKHKVPPGCETKQDDTTSGTDKTAGADADKDNGGGNADADGEDEKKPDVFEITLAGGVEGWNPSPSLTDVQAHGLLTNRCEADTKDCVPGQLRLEIDVGAKANIPGYATSLQFNGDAAVNVATEKVTMAGGIELKNFGPDQLNITTANLRLSNRGPSWCKPEDAGTVPADPGKADAADGEGTTLTKDQGLTFAVFAQGKVFDQTFTAQAEFAPSGYCLAATVNDFDPKLGADTPRKLFDNVGLYYSSEAVKLKLANGRTVDLAGKQAKLEGDVNVGDHVPSSVRGALSGNGHLAATLTKTAAGISFKGEASYTLTEPFWLIGRDDPNSTRFGLTDAKLTIEYAPGSSLALTLSAGAELRTAPSADRKIVASTTPFRVSGGIKLSGGVDATLTANVDSDRVPGGVVHDAFGQAGLSVEQLIVTLSVGTDTSFGVAAKGTLPERWASSIGAQGDTRVTVAFKISAVAANSCVELSLGDAKSTTPAARLGPLTATYARIAIAPKGCQIGTGLSDSSTYTIPPGIALAFNGTLGSAPVKFALELTRKDSGAFAIKGHVDVGAFDLGPVNVNQTKVDLDVDSEAKRFHFDISGGVTVGESSVTLAAKLDATEEQFAGKFDGHAQLQLAGFKFAEGDVHLDLAMDHNAAGWKLSRLSLDASTQIVGIGAHVQFNYADGRVNSAAGAFNAEPTIGPAKLSAGALFVYSAKAVKLNGDSCDLKQGFTPASDGKQLILRLCGNIVLGPITKGFTATIGLPFTIPIKFDTGRGEIPLGPVSVHAQASLDAALQINIGWPRFTVNDGAANVGGCLDLWFWKGCAEAISLKFNPGTGYFDGTFFGFDVHWGNSDWKRMPLEDQPQPAPPPPAPEPKIDPNEFVWQQPAQHAATFKVASRSDYLNSPSGHPVEVSGALFDPAKGTVYVFWCVNPVLKQGERRCDHGYAFLLSDFRAPFWADGRPVDTKTDKLEVGSITAFELGQDSAVTKSKRLAKGSYSYSQSFSNTAVNRVVVEVDPSLWSSYRLGDGTLPQRVSMFLTLDTLKPQRRGSAEHA